MNSYSKRILAAAGALALGATPAAAAVVTYPLNLRTGPGLQHSVITSMPEGAQVSTGSCIGEWCQVTWGGFSGYASSQYLAGENSVTYAAPAYATPVYPRTYARYDGPYAYGYYGARVGFYVNDEYVEDRRIRNGRFQ